MPTSRLPARPAAPDADTCILGSIYVGKINHVVKNINAAFVDLTQSRRAFLPLDGRAEPRLLNRPYDGRLLAGDEILVQVEKEAVKTKDPVVTPELSFSGRYAVLIPSEAPGRLVFSGKLDSAVKKRLRDFLPADELTEVLKNSSLIIRTNAGELTEKEPLVSDIQKLSALGLPASVSCRQTYLLQLSVPSCQSLSYGNKGHLYRPV